MLNTLQIGIILDEENVLGIENVEENNGNYSFTAIGVEVSSFCKAVTKCHSQFCFARLLIDNEEVSYSSLPFFLLKFFSMVFLEVLHIGNIYWH